MKISTSSTKGDVSRHSEVVEFKHIRNTSKSDKKSLVGVYNDDDEIIGSITMSNLLSML